MSHVRGIVQYVFCSVTGLFQLFQHNVFKFLPCCSMYQDFIPVIDEQYSIVQVDQILSVHSPIEWILGLFLLFDSGCFYFLTCESCCYEHGCTSTSRSSNNINLFNIVFAITLVRCHRNLTLLYIS